MNQRNNNLNGIIALVIIVVMIVSGASMLVPGYLATGSKFMLIFAVFWIGTLLLAMLRIILGMVKNKKNALDDMQQYYDHQEDMAARNTTSFSSVPSTSRMKKTDCKVQMIKAIAMMVLGSFVIIPALVASHSLLIVLFAFLWYGLLARNIVQNVKRMKNVEDDPTDGLQQTLSNSAEPPAMPPQQSMVVCPYCGKESPESFVKCCHCGRKL